MQRYHLLSENKLFPPISGRTAEYNLNYEQIDRFPNPAPLVSVTTQNLRSIDRF